MDGGKLKRTAVPVRGLTEAAFAAGLLLLRGTADGVCGVLTTRREMDGE